MFLRSSGPCHEAIHFSRLKGKSLESQNQLSAGAEALRAVLEQVSREVALVAAEFSSLPRYKAEAIHF